MYNYKSLCLHVYIIPFSFISKLVVYGVVLPVVLHMNPRCPSLLFQQTPSEGRPELASKHVFHFDFAQKTHRSCKVDWDGTRVQLQCTSSELTERQVPCTPRTSPTTARMCTTSGEQIASQPTVFLDLISRCLHGAKKRGKTRTRAARPNSSRCRMALIIVLFWEIWF